MEHAFFSRSHPFLAYGTVLGHLGVFDTGCMRMRQKWTNTDPAFGVSHSILHYIDWSP